jgi:hypothetical protein
VVSVIHEIYNGIVICIAVLHVCDNLDDSLLQELLKAVESGDAVQVKAQLQSTDVNFQDEVCRIPHRELALFYHAE